MHSNQSNYPLKNFKETFKSIKLNEEDIQHQSDTQKIENLKETILPQSKFLFILVTFKNSNDYYKILLKKKQIKGHSNFIWLHQNKKLKLSKKKS
jgi:hypothetical protein